MMDPAVKTALALCVLLAGICAALLFRSDRSQEAAVTAPGIEKPTTMLHVRAGKQALEQRRRSVDLKAIVTDEPQDVSRPAIVVTPMDRQEPPPALSPEYPETKQPPSVRWGMPMDRMMPVVALDQGVRIHRVVDGDTLESLAERYLGSSSRADEILAANRETLSDPKLLPIAADLKIPPRRAP